jgi:Protein of unknown function (DUF2934)
MLLEGLWSGVGENLAGRWLAVILTPAFFFWASGVAAWALGHHNGWHRIGHALEQLSGVEQAALIIGALLVVSASGVVIRMLALPVIRVLEGCWPPGLRAVGRWLICIKAPFVESRENRFDELNDKLNRGTAMAAESSELVRIDNWLRRIPIEEHRGVLVRRMPTRLGNVLRAAEVWPLAKYGLDAVRWWPRLWLLLPEDARDDMSAARADLDTAATVWLWGLLSAIWALWVWWAPLAAVGIMIAAYAAMVATAKVYGDLTEAAFDLYRWKLYQTLKWPMPTTPADEHRTGPALTEYIWRGSDDSTPRFAVAVLDSHGTENPPDQNAIAERAYFIHLEEGTCDELENWLRAERELTDA